mgnify:CR=1 FL=1
MKRKKLNKKAKTIILSIIMIILVINLIYFIMSILLLTGKIEDYKYLNINDKNKDEITNLLIEQKDKMFLISKDLNIDKCINNIKRIEVVFLFPDGEDYTIYCDDNKYKFSIDDSNYDLPNYISKNGRIGFKIK